MVGSWWLWLCHNDLVVVASMTQFRWLGHGGIAGQNGYRFV